MLVSRKGFFILHKHVLACFDPNALFLLLCFFDASSTGVFALCWSTSGQPDKAGLQRLQVTHRGAGFWRDQIEQEVIDLGSNPGAEGATP